jgi:GlpG protein
VWDKVAPVAAYSLPRGIAGFMVGWLVFCALGFTEIVGIYVANEAHIAGLVLGLLFGAASAALTRLFSRGSS